jgi:hypothetical protein
MPIIDTGRSSFAAFGPRAGALERRSSVSLDAVDCAAAELSGTNAIEVSLGGGILLPMPTTMVLYVSGVEYLHHVDVQDFLDGEMLVVA